MFSDTVYLADPTSKHSQFHNLIIHTWQSEYIQINYLF